jgi:hypothetical protein
MKEPHNRGKISLTVLFAGLMTSLAASAVALDIKAWESSINPKIKER